MDGLLDRFSRKPMPAFPPISDRTHREMEIDESALWGVRWIGDAQAAAARTFTPRHILTFTGRYIDPLNPDPEQIVIEDIAHSLSLQNRWGGHTRRPYSVAEHSIHVCDVRRGPYQFERLMHDAPEAYLIDLPSPLKHDPVFGEIYRRAEAGLWLAIAAKFGLVRNLPEEVHQADAMLLEAEHRVLMQGQRNTMRFSGADRRVFHGIQGDVESCFLRRFHRFHAQRQATAKWCRTPQPVEDS